MNVIPLRRAVNGMTFHDHYRADGRGKTRHQHVVRSEVHSHPTFGLLRVRLSWQELHWWDSARNAALVTVETIALGAAGVLIGLLLVAGCWWVVSQ